MAHKTTRTTTFKLFLALIVASAANGCFASTLSGTVIRVKDGDTVVVLDERHVQHNVRLAGIDAPERRQPFGERSKQSLSELVYGRRLEVDWHKFDRYGRVIGKLLMEGRDVNLQQVARGMAWHYKQYEREQTYADRRAYAEAETRARQERIGLWRDRDAIPPWKWRHAMENRKPVSTYNTY